MSGRTRRGLIAATAAISLVLTAGGTAGAAATYGDVTCHGGTIAPGRYHSLTVAGACTLTSSGTVWVKTNVTVAPHGLFNAVTPGTLKVHGNVIVASDGTAGIGCSPFIGCSVTTADTIGGSIRATGAWAVIVHSAWIGGSISEVGGGRTMNCSVIAPFGAPWYSDFEDNTVGGSVTIQRVHSCWLGFIRNTVASNVTVTGTRMGDPDANEITTNTVGGNLACFNNVPQVHFGDSGGTPNTVAGRKLGECVNM